MNNEVFYAKLDDVQEALDDLYYSGETTIHLLYLITKCFPEAQENLNNTIKASYTRGYIDGKEEALNG